jgi:hypothetical protein
MFTLETTRALIVSITRSYHDAIALTSVHTKTRCMRSYLQVPYCVTAANSCKGSHPEAKCASYKHAPGSSPRRELEELMSKFEQQLS